MTQVDHHSRGATIEETIRIVVREEIRSALEDMGRTPGHAFTTARVAGVLGVVPRVVVNMIREGELRGWRLHGDRGDWRVNSRDLERFLEDRANAA